MKRQTAKSSKRAKSKYYDLQFVFRYANVDVKIDDESYDADAKKKIREIVKHASQHIPIDKSYVEFKENKHEDVFMLEDGWNQLCKLAIDTKFGKKATLAQSATMTEAYNVIVLCYLYLFLENMGYSSDGIYLEIASDSQYMIEYYKDTVQEWKHYPGKWQTWNSGTKRKKEK